MADLRPCGTEAAYRRHRRHREMPCEPCYRAHADYVRDTRPSRAKEARRLRAAGDALHAWITVNATSIQQERLSHDKVLSDWEEARRG